MDERIPELRQQAIEAKRTRPYADPGYKPDGKKRYPIDTEEHARAAWGYINQAKNQKGYSSSQVSQIKTRITAALKKFGVDVSDDGDKKALIDVSSDVSHIEAQRNAAGGTTLVAVMADGTRVPLPPQARDGDVAGIVGGDGPFTGDPYQNQPLVKGPGDPHEMPFSKGPQVGPVPGDQPNMTVGPGTGLATVDANKGGPTVMKELLAKDDGPGTENDMPESSCDEMKSDDDMDEMDDRGTCPGGGMCPGDTCPDHMAKNDDDMEGCAYDPETGEPRADNDPNQDIDNPNDDTINLGLAEALDRTIVHAYKLAKDNPDLRKLLVSARKQLSTMRGQASAPDTEVNRMYDELRAEVGAPDTGTVAQGLAFLRSEGSLPVGYRGLVVRADPECHVTTAAERMAYEAKEKAIRATEDSVAADKRMRDARRLAELNGAIARNKAAREVR